MTAEDIMAMKAMSEGTDMSSYEHFMIADKSGKRASGTSIAAITIGSAALLTGIGAWIFGPVMASQARKSTEREIDRLAAFTLSERQERVGNQNIVQKTIVDVAQGSFAGAGANANATAQALAALINGGNGFNNAVENMSFVRTIPYSQPSPCCQPCCGN
ncbi:MAG: hypothetical protein ACRCX5_14500 [Bacteroidales bacterium]